MNTHNVCNNRRGGVSAAPHNPNNMSKELFSFQKGWSQVKIGDVAECREKLMKAMNITTRAAWGKRLKGEVEPRISEVKAIEDVFSEYGIEDVWGID